MVVAPAFMPRRIAAAPRTARPPARRWLAVPAVLAATIAMAAAWWWWRRPPAPAPEGAGLQLRVADLGGQLHIVWDRRAAAVVHAAAGTLEIADGGERTRVPFSPEHLRSGNVTYMPRSANVEVRLSVVAADGRRSEELVRFVGRQVAPPPEPPPQIAVAPPRVENRPAAEDRIRTDTPPPALRAFRMAEPRRSSRAPTLAAPPPEEFATRSVPGQAAGLVPLIASAEPPSPQLSLRTRATVAEPSRPQPPAAPVYSGPRSGRLSWTGELSAGAPLNIQGGRSSSGYLNGELPGIPVRIAAHAAELTSGGMRVWASNLAAVRDVAEPAGPENGWNRTSYAWDARRAQDVLVIDPPSEKNAWKGLALRGTRDRLSVIVIDWRVAQ